MTITPAQLRIDFPEFASTVTYPNSTMQFWLNVGYKFLDPVKWDDLLDLGIELFTAHHVVLAASNKADVVNGNTPGTTTGPVASRGVGQVSESYDPGSATLENAAHWNLTTYGVQYIQLVRMFGAGGMQLSGGCGGAETIVPWSFE